MDRVDSQEWLDCEKCLQRISVWDGLEPDDVDIEFVNRLRCLEDRRVRTIGDYNGSLGEEWEEESDSEHDWDDHDIPGVPEEDEER